MFVLSLIYTYFIFLNFVNGLDVPYNRTNNIETLASYLNNKDLTVVDTDHKRLLYFIFNRYKEFHHTRRKSWTKNLEQEVENNLNEIFKALRYNKIIKVTDTPYEKKVNYVVSFLNEHPQSTAYIYTEMQRIKDTGKVKDNLRNLISFLEVYEYNWVKKKLFKCFIAAKKQMRHPHVVYWTQQPNALSFDM